MYNSDASGSTQSANAVQSAFASHVHHRRGPALGVAISLASVPVAQVVATSGADFAFIDMEHSPFSAETTTNLVHAVAATSRGACYPIVRVPSHGVEWIKWALDSGAAGIIIPMVNDAAEMRAIIDKAVYPPGGRRSFGPALAPFGSPEGPQSGVAGYLTRAKRGDIALFPMIESRDGLANVDDILAVEGVSGIFIGPVDLRMAMGLPGALDGAEPDFNDAIQKVVSAAHKTQKIIGTVAMGEPVVYKRTSEGFDFIVSSADYGVLASGISAQLSDARKGVDSAQQDSSRL